MLRRPITSGTLNKPTAPYSLGIRTGNLIFISGIVSIDSDGNTVGVTAQEQTRQILSIISEMLGREGASMENVVKTTVYLSDFAHYSGMNEVYAQYFPKTPPARATIGAQLVKSEWLVEIDAIAVVEAEETAK